MDIVSNLRFKAAMLISKSVSVGMKALRRQASYLPGKLALKICPDFLSHIGRPKTIVAVTGTNGMKNAQVTAGGLETKDFDPRTMMSKRVRGLFACGEALDIDGDCGGFNLQWAWSSGRLAGVSAAREIR